jgi:NifU-like protein involved in Fe-S cluster formation
MSAEAAASSMSKKPELYTKDMLRLAASLPHNDRLENPHASASKRSPVCGSEMTVDLRCDEGGAITELAFRGRACAMGQASAALLRLLGIGNDKNVITATRAGLASALSGASGFDGLWPELSVFQSARAHPARHAAILLPFDALIAALEGTG